MNSNSTDIAIVGIACRYPGEARDPEGFLSMLKNGRAAWSQVPKERFDISAYHHPSNERQGSIVAEGGHFLEQDIATFDAPFFSTTAAEANAMDPQQRMLLELTYEAFESAGIPMIRMVGSNTSVYVGCFTRDYEAIAARQIDNTLLYQATGQGFAMQSNRLSWFYDLKGPSLTLDTACSSSLLALHLACQSLRNGESKCSVVGGTSLMLSPDIMRTLTSLHFLSPDSRCYSFDDRANGYARGEGIATVILKPVADAVRDGDIIRAVIRGTGTNQDGRTPGITLPSSQAQADLIATTYRNANLSFGDTQYFEAHGTGTPAGDPMELGALGATFGSDTLPRSQPLYVGSVKTNIGHLEGGAGLAGLIKSVLSVESGYIFPSLNFQKPNPRLRLQEWGLEIPTTLTPWPTTGTRRVSINSFGYGGSNVHVIIDDGYHYLQERCLRGFTNTTPRIPILDSAADSSTDSGFSSGSSSEVDSQESFRVTSLSRPKKLFVLSGPDQASLRRLGSSYATFIDRKHEQEGRSSFLDTFAHTLGCRRSVFPWKQMVVGSSAKEISTALKNCTAVRSKKAPQLGFIFTGQGAQWCTMGRELMAYEVFAASVRNADAHLKSLGATWSAVVELSADELVSRINDAEFSQPLCTVLQVALVDLLSHWNVKPRAVAGHSSGEIAAAYAAGALSAEDAWQISFQRGLAAARVSQVSPHLRGGMTAVGLSEAKALEYLEQLGPQSDTVIACINSPESVTVSGDTDVLEALESRLSADGIFNRRLKVANAYHSPHMKGVADEYKDSISGVRPKDIVSGCIFYSSVTGAPREGSSLDAEYWTANMINPVKFLHAVEQMLPDPSAKRRRRQKNGVSVNTFLEIGPTGALQGPLRQIVSAKTNADDISLLSMLSRKADAVETSLTSIGKLWMSGVDGIDLAKVNDCGRVPRRKQFLCDTPTYPWNHSTKYWHEGQPSVNHRFPRAPRLDLLGSPNEDWNPSQPTWRHRLRIGELPWLKEHVIQGSTIFPAAGYICAVLEGARQIADPVKTPKRFELRDVLLGRALEIDGDTDVVELVTTFKPRKLGLKSKEAPWTEWTIYSDGQLGHIEHCSGLLYTHYHQEASLLERGREEQLRNLKLADEYRTTLAKCVKSVAPNDLYDKLNSIGLQYGPLFQGIVAIQNGAPDVGCTTVQIPDTKSAMPANFEYDHLLHPCTLDACFQSIFVTFTGDGGTQDQAMVPTSIESIKIAAELPKGAGSKFYGYARGVRKGFRGAVGTVRMSHETWNAPLIEIEGISCIELGALTGGQVSGSDSSTALRKVQSYWHWESYAPLLKPQTAGRLIGTHDEEIQAFKHDYPDAFPALEKMAAIMGQRALKALTEDGEKRLQPHLVPYVEWLRTQNELAHQGALPFQDGTDSWVTMSHQEEEDFFTEMSLWKMIDAKLLLAIGHELPGILNGTVIPLSVMTGDNMLSDLYADGIDMRLANSQIAKYIAIVGHQKPDMKILEVGGGTASLSVPILQALDGHRGSTTRCSSYVFTDICPELFEGAQKKLKHWSSVVSYQRLDIEQDPVEQGFQEESFDVIAASNVLHLTKDLDNTLQNINKLLKPDGNLVIGEITYPRARIAMIMGTLSNWWQSEDGRRGGSCISEEKWADVFERNGLVYDFGVKAVPEADIDMVTTLCATKPISQSLPFSKVLVVDNGRHGPQVDRLSSGIVEDFSARGLEVSRLSIAEFDQEAQASASERFVGTAVISLLEAEVPYFKTLDESQFMAVQKLLLKTAGVMWITKGDRLGLCDPDFRMVDGVLRVIRNEDSALRLHSLDFEATMVLGTDVARQNVSDVFMKVFGSDKAVADTEFAYHDGKLMIPRLYDDAPKNYDLRMLHDRRPPTYQPMKQEARPLRMTIGVPGMLDTLHFVDDDIPAKPLPPDHIEFEVKAIALNFMDIMVAIGFLAGSDLGVDAAGVISRVGSQVTNLKPGDRVASTCMGSYRNIVRCNALLPQKIPDDMSFEDAASLSTVHITAYQSLIEIARLQAGETILIHAAAGGLGQATIQLAKYLGAEIFATVGSPAKKKFLVDTYGIPADHIFNSRDLTFADAIMRSTNGQGVDVVLNSLAGEALRKTWTCIKDFGRFIEVGKKDILGNTGLEMMPFLRNVTFAGVNLEHIYRSSVDTMARISEKTFDLIRAGHIGIVKPIKVFSIANAEKAFRTMQQGKHTGKLILRMDDHAEVLATPHDCHPLSLRDNGTYLLVGGLGGLGRAQALWLAQNGARHLAFVSRSGAASDAAKETLKQLEEQGVHAKAYACDISDRDALLKTLDTMAGEMPRIYGVIQGAMVLSDGFFRSMSFDRWTAAVLPKVQGSYNLHELLPADLDFFIMLSSLAGVCGTRGQSNYAAGNTYQDALALHRRALGLPANVIDLGMMAKIGVVEESKGKTGSPLQIMAHQLRAIAIEPDEFYSLLKSCITGYTDGDNPMPVQASTGLGTGGMVRTMKATEDWDFYWHNDAKMAYLRRVDILDTSSAGDEAASQFKTAIATATSFAAAMDIVQEALITKLAKAMMIPPEDIDVTKPISTYGVDSLVAVEVKNWVSRGLRSDLSVFEILSPVPMSQLIHKLTSKCPLLSAEAKAGASAENAEEGSAAAPDAAAAT